MLKFPPLSRQRLYSSVNTYLSLTYDLITGRIYKGNDKQKLEEKLTDLTGCEYVKCVPQARVGLYLGIKSILDNYHKKKIIMSPYTIYAVVNMVVSAGGIPVFADIDPKTCNIDSDEIEKLIDDETAAVLVTHLHGLSCEMDKISEICKKHQVYLIEDAAQSFGSRFKGKLVGSFGDIGVFSFGMMKNVNSLYGGAVITKHADLFKKIQKEIESYKEISSMSLFKRMLYGLVLDIATLPLVYRLSTFWLFRYGYLHNIGPINMLSRSENDPKLIKDFPEGFERLYSQAQARLVLKQLKYVDEYSKLRIETAKFYHKELSANDNLLLPPLKEDGSHTYMSFPIQVKDRNDLLRFLYLEVRDVAAQHLRNCASLEVFKDYARECPNAEKTAVSTVLLPTYPRYGLKEAKKTANAIKKYLQN